MAKVSLRIYNREIEGLIDQNQFDEAIAHCKHILKTFPKHLETYRLLGKAFLESKRYQDAAEIFQRVLLAVPDDFVSHVGMSIIRDDEGKLDDAIWHMERAFESQPSNAAVQAELQRLYGQRDGVQPPKVRMTRGALAHMYVQGELYPQAIAEMRGLLAEDPSRMDMQALLAMAYFRNGQKVEATEMCSLLLKRYAYCLDANRILVEVLPGTGLAENTQVYHHRVNELDPYAAFVTGSIFQSDAVPDAAVNLERLDYRPGQEVDMGTSWPASLESGLQREREADEQTPDWLQSAAQPSAASPEPPAPAEASIPDFMRAAGWAPATGAAVESPLTFDESAEGEMGEALPADDIPDWLRAMAPSAGESAPPPAGEAEAVPSAAAPAEDVPDWLKEMKPEEPAAEMPAPADLPAAEDVPDWLKEMKPEEPAAEPPAEQMAVTPPPPSAPAAMASIGDLGKSEEEQDASFAWLENLAARQGARSDELLTQPDERLESAPEWVEQAKDLAAGEAAEVQPAAAGAVEPKEEPEEALPDWLKEEEAAAEPPVMPAAAAAAAASIGDLGKSEEEQDASFAWLENLAAKQGARPDELLTEPEERLESAPEWVQQAQEVAAPAPPPEEEFAAQTDDWLKDLEASEEAPASLDATGAWLRGLEGQESPAEPAPKEDALPDWLQTLKEQEEAPKAPAAPAEMSAADVELPAWLQNLETPAPQAEEVEPAEELPEWLRADLEAAPEAKPTTPADWQPAAYSEPTTQPLPEAQKAAPVTPVEPPPAPPPVEPVAQLIAERQMRQTGSLTSDPTLRAAQAAMSRGDVPLALQEYGKLIKKARLLDEVIFDLREALYRYPVDVLIWQALGDAYMRANRLQEALDSYTQAEELLR